MTAQRAGEQQHSQEALLFEHAKWLDRHRAGRQAVHLHLSLLKPHNRLSYHIRIAVITFAHLVTPFGGQIFALANCDIVFTVAGVARGEIDAAVEKVRALFKEDPLALDGPGEANSFCSWYDIAADYDLFLAAARALAVAGERERRETAATAPSRPGATTVAMDPAVLARIEQALERADLTNVMRRQPICEIVPDGAPEPIFRELYVSIPDLQKLISPGINLTADRWLFQRLTATLDRRMLALIPRYSDSSIASRFSLNLNLGTVLSREFLAFDAALQAVARGTVVIEMPSIDMLADPGAFLFARDFLRERGYRVCLDGLSHLAARLFDGEGLGVDYVKIVWSPDLGDARTGQRFHVLRETVRRIGDNRVILCRCDAEEAVELGHSFGISLFQGRRIDALLAASIAAARLTPAPALARV